MRGGDAGSSSSFQPEVGDLVLQEHPEPLLDLLKALPLFHGHRADAVGPAKQPSGEVMFSTLHSDTCAEDVNMCSRPPPPNQGPPQPGGRSGAQTVSFRVVVVAVWFCLSPAGHLLDPDLLDLDPDLLDPPANRWSSAKVFGGFLGNNVK